MKLSHIAIWTDQLEVLRSFYTHYFNGVSNEKYTNPVKGFSSYFITFENGVALDLMERKDITECADRKGTLGLTHLAFDMESPEQVDRWIEQMRQDGLPVTGEPRITGDGFYEGVIEDPDGNQIELIALPS